VYAVKPLLPRIYLGTPSSQGLVFDPPLYEKNGTSAKDIIANLTGAFSNSPTWSDDTIGAMLTFNGGNPGSVVDFTLVGQQRGFTQVSFMAIAYRTGVAPGNLGRIFSETNTTSSGFQLADQDNVNQIRFIAPFDTTSGTWSAPATSLNTMMTYVVTYDGSSTSNVPNIWVNGVKQTVTTQTAPSGTLALRDTHLLIGNISQTGNVFTRTFNGKIGVVRKWSRMLDAQEAVLFSAFPWLVYSDVKNNWLTSGGNLLRTLPLLGAGL